MSEFENQVKKQFSGKIREIAAKEIGYQDTIRGIKTFPAQGTDKFKTIQDFFVAMTEAAAKCRDKNYAKGVLAAINEFKSL